MPSERYDEYPSGKETLVVSTSAVGFSQANYAGAYRAEVVVKADIIRAWSDGSTPTSTVGVQWAVDDEFELCHPTEIKNFLAIRDSTSSGSSTLSATFYKKA